MSIQTPGAIWKFKEFNDFDKAYSIKLLASTISGIIMGIVSGIVYLSSQERLGWVGLIFYFAQSYLVGLYVKKKYALKDMTPIRAMRHGIMMGFFVFLYLWVAVFNFFLF
ncbi:MAG: hypothetical protein D6732_28305 [Methanobacteriota archaeon]|nr:MAG: hypothetical protein D6732_28305 [Euryarchaeota archaeon]